MAETGRGRSGPRGHGRLRRAGALVALGALALTLGVIAAPSPAGAAPCDAPVTSPIACENSKPGNPASEWDISGSDTTILGFATDMSVNKGTTVSFKVKASTTNYRIDIYRVGYYGGNGARKVASVNPTAAQSQPNCLTQSTTGLVDCGNWAVTAAWAVPADAVSGVYIARLVRNDTGGASHILFVVRDDASHSSLLFQTSDTTWQAYNQYGGNSLYVGNPAGRAYKVSYNRPVTTRDTGAEDSFFNAEYPMVRFLEANGFDVSYTSGVDSDRNGSLIQQHRTFLSVGHDEYWSGGQRTNVEAARAAGVNLAFFSGNEVFWKTRWESSIATGGATYRTLVSYKETHANAVIDPLDPPTWTGTWRDPRFSPPADGGRPENALTGTIFTVNDGANGTTSIVVPSDDGKMRFWRNTTVASLSSGQSATLPNGTLGYEWDEDLDNGSRPAGQIRLSTATYSVGSKLQDYGSTYGADTATHHLTLYRGSGGGLVFGAGSAQWAWGLDANHDRGSTAADTRMKQATLNLLADMGAQPATIQAGLTAATASTDTTAPTSTITSPAAGATVPTGQPLTISGTAADTGGGVVGGVEVSVDNGATWHPATGRGTWSFTYTPSVDGTVTVRSRAADDSANLESPKPGNTITVGTGGSACPCTTMWPASATPTNPSEPDGSAVELGVKFQSDQAGTITGIRFYKGSGNTGTHVGNLWSSTGTRLATANFSGETASGWQQVNFTTPVSITANTTYVASYFAPAGVYAADSNYFATAGVDRPPLHALSNGSSGGNGVYAYGGSPSFPNQTYQSTNYWVDVVYAPSGGDTTPPTVTATTPASGATGVNVASNATATFSEAVQSATISFTLRDAASNAVAAAVTYDATTRTATLNPNADLAAGATYTATVTGAKDTAGNTMAGSTTWSFTTAAAVDTTPPTVTATSPASGATGVSVASNVTATFSESVQSATVSFTLRDAASNAVAAAVTYDDPTRTATLNPTADLAAGATYTATVTGAKDAAGNTMAGSTTWSFTTTAPDTTPPTVTATSPASGATGVSVASNAAATFSESVQSATVSFTLRDAASNAVAAAVTYDDPTRTATLNPTADLAAGATYTATVTGAKDAAGNTMAGSTTWSFTTSATTCPCTIWPSTATPVNASEPDGSAVELGVKFQADQAGTITGVRFYKGSGNTGTHIGNLWSSTGTRLATVTFANETATGWQQMNFSAPVAVTAGTTYVASYFAPAGVYAADGNYFATAGVDRPPLHALANGSSGGNGVYLYGASSAFPNQTYQSTNYWVDVVFVPNGPDTTPPAISSVSAIPGGTSAVVTWTTNEVSNSRVDYGTDSASLASSVSDATMVTSHSVTLNGLAPATTYFFRVTSADAAGNPATSPAPPGAPATFATPQPSLGDNTTADFAAGTLGTYAYLAQTADGEVALAPADGGEFSSGLPAGWATTAIQTGGTATVSGGKVTVDGARIAPTPTYAAGRSLEFSATFSGQAGQSVGFGLTLNESPWAMFGTNGGGSLYARSRLNNSNTNTNLGASLLGSAHRFRIDWNATNIVFSVDGVVKATHSRTISVAMRPVVRENTVGGGSVVVDWLRMTPYSSPGTFTSRLIDAGAPVPWTTAVWTADLPAGTSLTVSVTTGNSQDPNDGTWTALTPLAGSGATVGTTARYLQYRLTLSTTAGGQTPALRDITFSHG